MLTEKCFARVFYRRKVFRDLEFSEIKWKRNLTDFEGLEKVDEGNKKSDF